MPESPDTSNDPDYHPHVSVIVLTHNGEKHIRDCLLSLQATEYPAFDITVVDNGSCDGSSDLVRTEFPNIRLVRLERNLGYCGGNNVGIGCTSSPYVALVNDDVLADCGWLRELVPIADRDPKIAMVGATIVPMSLKGYPLDPAAIGGIRDAASAPGAAMLVKRAFIEHVGLLNEDFFCYYEEYEWSWRAIIHGYSIKTAAASVVYHVGGATSNMPKLLRSRKRSDWITRDGSINRLLGYFCRNEILLYWTTLERWNAVLLSFRPVLKTLVYALRSRYAFWSMLWVWTWIACNIPTILQRRRTLQRSRTESDARLLALLKQQRVDWRVWSAHYASIAFPRPSN